MQVVSDIRPEPELKADFIQRNPVTTTVQVAPELSEHEVRRVIPGFSISAVFLFFFGLVCTLFGRMKRPWEKKNGGGKEEASECLEAGRAV